MNRFGIWDLGFGIYRDERSTIQRFLSKRINPKSKTRIFTYNKMKKLSLIFIAVFLCPVNFTLAQKAVNKDVPTDQLVEIVRAEDELRFDKTLTDFLKDQNPSVRARSALAAGRIGDDAAIPKLSELLLQDSSEDVRQMAAFALGEIESVEGADAVLKILKETNNPETVRANATEAAGKIAAANAKDAKSAELGKAILENLEYENGRDAEKRSGKVILPGITAVLRAKPEGGAATVAKFLDHSDSRIRADAANTLARLGAKNSVEKFRSMLETDKDPNARANAARALGAAEDKTSVELLLKAATTDKDLRVRINAIRALGSLKEKSAAEKLLVYAEKLFAKYKKSKYENPVEMNELLTMASALGTILQGTDDKRAVKFFEELREFERYMSPEVELAFARISPRKYMDSKKGFKGTNFSSDGKIVADWRVFDVWAQVLGELAGLSEDKNEFEEVRSAAENALQESLDKKKMADSKLDIASLNLAMSSILNAYAKFKPDDLPEVLREYLKHEDVVVRSTAANLLGDIKSETPEQAVRIYRELSDALWKARTDKLNDASLAILDALKKQYDNRPQPMPIKVAYFSPFVSAVGSPDYLIRRKAVEIYKSFDIKQPDPMTVGNPDYKPFEVPEDYGIVKFDEKAENGALARVKRADYKKALSRKNGKTSAVLKTDKGELTIELFPEDAPLTVDNFINLAKSGYFNGLEIHRVVPNFVVQDGDPRGDGSGGPGWQIRCEINQLTYERGTVGMALSGKDTGGSQWFVAHSPQPHLDGGYTVFGRVNEKGMEVVDKLVRGDRIISIKIVEK
jgi:cyclophilin family peptidyl-prolyl cis-trans isomerase/HEAT repeat protein